MSLTFIDVFKTILAIFALDPPGSLDLKQASHQVKLLGGH